MHPAGVRLRSNPFLQICHPAGVDDFFTSSAGLGDLGESMRGTAGHNEKRLRRVFRRRFVFLLLVTAGQQSKIRVSRELQPGKSDVPSYDYSI